VGDALNQSRELLRSVMMMMMMMKPHEDSELGGGSDMPIIGVSGVTGMWA
jgi:hypothetical protein